MKSTKLFILGLFISLAWVACKNDSAAEQPAEGTEEVVESSFKLSQAEVIKNFEKLGIAVAQKITELESVKGASLSGGPDPAAKEEIAKYKEFQSRLEEIGPKVAAATEENWEKIEEECKSLHFDIKSALSNMQITQEESGQISSESGQLSTQ